MSKALLILGLVFACLAWFLWSGITSHKPTNDVATAPVTTPSPSPISTPAAAKNVMSDDESIPLSFRERVFREGVPSKGLRKKFFDALAQIEPMHLFKGTVIQHLQDGDLLVEVWTFRGEHCVSRGLYAIFGVPGAENIIDQTEIDCMVLPVGVYQYTTVDGARRTIYEMIYVPKASSLPKPTAPTSGADVASIYPPGLDTPEAPTPAPQAASVAKRPPGVGEKAVLLIDVKKQTENGISRFSAGTVVLLKSNANGVVVVESNGESFEVPLEKLKAQ